MSTRNEGSLGCFDLTCDLINLLAGEWSRLQLEQCKWLRHRDSTAGNFILSSDAICFCCRYKYCDTTCNGKGFKGLLSDKVEKKARKGHESSSHFP